jgi:hypothetical protein
MVSRMDAATTPTSPLLTRTEAVRAVVVTGLLAVGAIGVLLVMRRAAGALTVELAAFELLASLVLAAAVVFGGRIAWREFDATPFDSALAWGGTAALVVFSLGCAWPNTESHWWLLWLPLVGADHFSRRQFLKTASRGARPRGPTPAGFAAPGIRPLAPPFQGGESEGDVLQTIVRVRSADGVESIRGTLRAEFAAGQRHATLYVGFCPPLERLPDVEVEVVDGPDAAVKVVQALAHGVQLELRLAEPADEACVATVEISATPCVPLASRQC